MSKDSQQGPLCTLCGGAFSQKMHQHAVSGAGYFDCPTCSLIFLEPQHYLGPEDEKQRYLLHENNSADPGYRRFLMPVFEEVQRRSPVGSRGLDFGAGPGPALAEMLEASGRSMKLFDPFFHPHAEHLSEVYDFIVCTEAAEHFQRPADEFKKMRLCLRSGGFLVIMTQMVPEAGFAQWYYHRDPTHVCFYRPRSFDWIAETYGFSRVTVLGSSLVVLEV